MVPHDHCEQSTVHRAESDLLFDDVAAAHGLLHSIRTKKLKTEKEQYH